MGLYNVVNRSDMQGGQAEDVSDIVANFDAIAAILNGGIDDSNLNAAAALAYTKLALAGKIKLNSDVDVTTFLAIARIAGYPTDGTMVPWGDGTWHQVSQGAVLRAGYPRTTAAVVANQAYLVPIENLYVPTFIDNLQVRTIAAAGNSDIGLFRSDDLITFTLIASSGSLATVGPGVHSKTFTRSLLTPIPGRKFFAAYVCNNAGTQIAMDDTAPRGRIQTGLFPLATFVTSTGLSFPVASISGCDLTLFA
jgi:hypothetical protein